MMECLHCFTGAMLPPPNLHPGYIECPNCGTIELTYEPQPYQDVFHSAPYTERFNPRTGEWELETQLIGLFGGYGSAKSRASLQEIVLRALENPGGTGLLTAPTLPQLKRTTLKTLFQEVLPPPLIESFNKSEGELRLINGFTFYTIPSDDEEKLRSINAGIVHIEEASAIKRTIYDQLLTRVRDGFVKNKVIIVCSNPDIGWIKDVFVDNDKRKSKLHPEHEEYNPAIQTFIWKTALNQYLPPDFIEINSKSKPEWWKKRFLEGSFDHSDGLVYPNIMKCFKESSLYEPVNKHGKPYTESELDANGIPKDWSRFTTMDHGLRNATAVYFHAIDPHRNQVVTYKEYYMPNRNVPDHASALKPMLEEVPHGLMMFMVADPSIRNKTDPVNGKSVQGLYQEYGIFWSSGNNNVEAGILKVNSYVERGAWVILTDRCPELVKELINYKFKPVTMDDVNKNLDERPVKANDHGCDSVRYGFMRLPDDPALLKTLSYEPVMSYTGGSKYENEYSWDSSHDSDYGGDYSGYGY